MNFVPIQNSTHFSLLNSISNPKSLVAKSKELGYSSVGLTDYHSLAGAVEFSDACKKSGLKSILGTKFRLHDEQYITLIAKNLNGWRRLVKLISDSNDKENHINGKARLSQQIISLRDLSDLYVILGDLESELFHECFSLHGFHAKDEATAIIGLSSDVEDRVKEYIGKYLRLFDSDNVFVQINLLNSREIPYQKLISEILRKVSKDLGVKCIAGVNSHYTSKESALEHRLLMCSDQKVTFNETEKIMAYWKNYVFFHSNNFDIPSIDEVKKFYTDEEIENSSILAEGCEKFDITSKPKLPHFDCPNGKSEIDYLKELSREGYKLKCRNWDRDVYGARAKSELEVIEKVGLAGYFLIVQDYVNEAKRRGYLVGPGRGSAAGSLICYLTGITSVEPIPYNLIFERFYNEGRNTKDNIAFPDIDIDFPMFAREEMIEYVSQKYGSDRVAQMATYGSLQGRSAIREVLRIQNACDVNTINEISKLIPQKHKIADKLEEDDENSIIRWTLVNEPKLLEDYVIMEDGILKGELARYFEQAIKIEGIYKNAGKHAAGVIISAEPLDQVCPMVWHDESNSKIVGYEMKSAEKSGLVKCDFLGINLLDKCSFANNILRGGK